MTLEGRVALVSGASRGIGEWVARHLGGAGAKVAVAARSETVSDPRLPGTIHSVAKTINDAGGQASAVRLDVRDPASIQSAVAAVVDRWGKIDILVNNAAVLVPGTIETVKDRHIDLIWEIDLRGPLLLTKAVVPHMKAAGGGHIINVSSVAGVFPGPGPYKSSHRDGVFYGMVKAGLERASQALASELQGFNISVNVLSPSGAIRTPGHIWAQNDREHPALDFEPAHEMGKGVVWLCQHPAPQFTGHILFDQDLCREHGL